MILDPGPLTDFVIAQLVAQPNLQVFDGRPDDAVKAVGYAAGQTQVAVDPDGRAHMYAAVYVSVPSPGVDDERVCGAPGTPTSVFQVTAAGGDPYRARLAARKVMAALIAERIPGGGLIRLDLTPGPVRIDTEPSPSRAYYPLIFRVSHN